MIDLAGPRAVWLGVQLAHYGYRPVPVFNACPPPLTEDGTPLNAAVDVDAVLAALVAAADVLGPLKLAPDAPPAFLVDARRSQTDRTLYVGDYDNRSMVLGSDFPSVKTLQSSGIDSVLLVRENRKRIDLDLAAVLGQWRRSGMELRAKWLDGGPVHPLRLSRAAALLAVWARFRASMRLRTEDGDYGGIVAPSSG